MQARGGVHPGSSYAGVGCTQARVGHTLAQVANDMLLKGGLALIQCAHAPPTFCLLLAWPRHTQPIPDPVLTLTGYIV